MSSVDVSGWSFDSGLSVGQFWYSHVVSPWKQDSDSITELNPGRQGQKDFTFKSRPDAACWFRFVKEISQPLPLSDREHYDKEIPSM